MHFKQMNSKVIFMIVAHRCANRCPKGDKCCQWYCKRWGALTFFFKMTIHTSPYSIGNCATYDCWKPVLHETSTEPSQAMLPAGRNLGRSPQKRQTFCFLALYFLYVYPICLWHREHCTITYDTETKKYFVEKLLRMWEKKISSLAKSLGQVGPKI